MYGYHDTIKNKYSFCGIKNEIEPKGVSSKEEVKR
jgi:hypothetical protein